MMPRSSTPRCSKKRRSSAATNALCTASGMVESGTQTRRLRGSKTLAKVFPSSSSATARAGELASLELRLIGQIGGSVIEELDHLAEVDHRIGDVLVLAELVMAVFRSAKLMP